MPNWGVRILLTQWGRWSRTAIPGELPSMSTTEKARMGRGGNGDDRAMPPGVALIDKLVCEAPETERRVLIVYYAQAGTMYEKAVRLDMSPMEFRDWRDRAESFIAIRL